METLAAELYEKVWLLGGTISGEHGDGLSRTPFLARQYGPLVNVFREVKQIFDPQGSAEPRQDRAARADADDAQLAADDDPLRRSKRPTRRGDRNERPHRRARSHCNCVGSRTS